MKEYATEKLRNVALLGHSSSGKTTFAEALLFASGAISRMGKVEDGTTVSDFDDEAKRRHQSLSLSVLSLEWKAYKINLIDTPGNADFQAEMKSAARAADQPDPPRRGPSLADLHDPLHAARRDPVPAVEPVAHPLTAPPESPPTM